MSTAAPFVDEYLRGRADHGKPIYRQLREEGVSQAVIELLHEGRDMLELRWGPYGFAQWFYDVSRAGVTRADVWPKGRLNPVPAVPPFDVSPRMRADWEHLKALHAAEWDALEASWVAEWAAADSPAAHRAAAALYEGGAS